MGAPADDASNDPQVRVVLVDGRDDRRGVMRQVLETETSCVKVVGEASSGATALAVLDQQQADVVMLDIQMPVDEGMKTIAAVRRVSPRLRIVMCSFLVDRDTSERAVAAGADACLAKPVRRRDLRAALGRPPSGSPAIGDGTPPRLATALR